MKWLILVFLMHSIYTCNQNTFLINFKLVFNSKTGTDYPIRLKINDQLDEAKAAFSVILIAKQGSPINYFAKIEGKNFMDTPYPSHSPRIRHNVVFLEKGNQIDKIIYKPLKLALLNDERSVFGPFLVAIKTKFEYKNCCLEIEPVYRFLSEWDDAKPELYFSFELSCHQLQLVNCRFLMNKKQEIGEN